MARSKHIVKGSEKFTPYRSASTRIWWPYELETVYILGMGPSGHNYVNHQYHYMRRHKKPQSEVWVVNSAASVFAHDVVFNMHELPGEDRHKFYEFYKVHDKPLVTLRHLPEIKNSYEYPLDHIVRTFGTEYFRNGIAYMVAFAIACKVKHIFVFGADYQVGTEYEEGRPNVEYWLGRAEQSGIILSIGDISSLCDVNRRSRVSPAGHCYGYGEEQPIFSRDDQGQLHVKDWQKRPVAFADVETAVSEEEKRVVKCRRPTATERVVVKAKTVSK